MSVIETLFPEIEPCYRTRVYFGLGQNGQLKIGITGRLSGRRGGEMHFTELCSVPGDRLVEQRYHSMYRAERIGRTEWFILSDRLLIDLTVMCAELGRGSSAQILKGLTLARMGQAAA